MFDEYNLKRFVDAQQRDYDVALGEIKNGRKRSHWMWYIFPQIQGLGYSEISKHFAIKGIDEAAAYLKHSILGERLKNICNELLKLPTNDAHSIFGSPDDLKLKSSMTLFASVPETDPVFAAVLVKFFSGAKDDTTLRMIRSNES